MTRRMSSTSLFKQRLALVGVMLLAAGCVVSKGDNNVVPVNRTYFTELPAVFAEVNYLNDVQRPRFQAVIPFTSVKTAERFSAKEIAAMALVGLSGNRALDKTVNVLEWSVSRGNDRMPHIKLYVPRDVEALMCGKNGEAVDRDGNPAGVPCGYMILKVKYQDGEIKEFLVGPISVPPQELW